MRNAKPKQRQHDEPGSRILRLKHDERSYNGYADRILPYVLERPNLCSDAAKIMPPYAQKKHAFARHFGNRTHKALVVVLSVRVTKARANGTNKTQAVVQEMQADRERAVKRRSRPPRFNIGADSRFTREITECTFGHACPVCDRLWFKNNLSRIRDIRNEAKRELAVGVLKEAFPSADDHAEFEVCGTYKGSPVRGNVLPFSVTNGLSNDVGMYVNIKQFPTSTRISWQDVVSRNMIYPWFKHLANTPLYLYTNVQIDWERLGVFRDDVDGEKIDEEHGMVERAPAVYDVDDPKQAWSLQKCLQRTIVYDRMLYQIKSVP
ncbi:hypothetical protein HPB52_006139 [Rhipicephalus sanguineus]|uniref:Uncharacterized protein n=1 Tax=Rhipicephalus sanguineus TaxID=34632 RepID=A0A9D4PUP6_RHISA|nr:hypothetical protein HPB52_006139 [Rhipicephalus sanguineus]